MLDLYKPDGSIDEVALEQELTNAMNDPNYPAADRSKLDALVNTPEGAQAIKDITKKVISQAKQQLGGSKPPAASKQSGGIVPPPQGPTPTVDKNGNPIGADPTKIAFVKLLEFISNTFYRTDENNDILVELSKKGKSDNFYDLRRIVLSEQIVDQFGEMGLPRFLIYYHELGHHLYSQGVFKLIKAWEKLVAPSPIAWDPKYMHLFNWIEDLYIEEKIVQDYSYLTDVVTCIKKLPVDYDIKRIEYAFNYWYNYLAPTPALTYTDQVQFKAYMLRLLNLRKSGKTRFGHGIVTTLSMKKSRETRFVELLIEFYDWCVDRKIFPDNKPLPQLQNPNNHLQQPGGGNGQGTPQAGQQGSDGGTHDEHSGQVGKNIQPFQEVAPIKKPTTFFKDEIQAEKVMIDKQMLDMTQRVQTDSYSLDGLFTAKYKNTAIIQPRVIVPNFFNPSRLMDQILFKMKQHTYMNVAIYRDISGSTEGARHRMMHHVCELLYKEIPVDITYYLYSSGHVSIIEVPYIPWENSNKVPSIYKKNPLYNQLTGGTNSDAIADVITQQLSDKWLNIILTDGDLDALMQRDNIYALLKNVFVVTVGSKVDDQLLNVEIKDKLDVQKIIPTLSTITLDYNEK